MKVNTRSVSTKIGTAFENIPLYGMFVYTVTGETVPKVYIKIAEQSASRQAVLAETQTPVMFKATTRVFPVKELNATYEA